MVDCEAVVLAGGYSSRADGFKMAFDLGGCSVLGCTVKALLPFCSRVFVVSGFRAEIVRELMADYAAVTVVHNSDFAAGMFSSVRAGAAHVRAARFFITPGDCPLIPPQVCAGLLRAHADVVQPAYHGKKGHPVLLDGTLAKEIAAAPAEFTLRDVLRRHDGAVVPVEEPGVLLDIDTQEDFARLRLLAGGRQTEKEGENRHV